MTGTGTFTRWKTGRFEKPVAATQGNLEVQALEWDTALRCPGYFDAEDRRELVAFLKSVYRHPVGNEWQCDIPLNDAELLFLGLERVARTPVVPPEIAAADHPPEVFTYRKKFERAFVQVWVARLDEPAIAAEDIPWHLYGPDEKLDALEVMLLTQQAACRFTDSSQVDGLFNLIVHPGRLLPFYLRPWLNNEIRIWAFTLLGEAGACANLYIDQLLPYCILKNEVGKAAERALKNLAFTIDKDTRDRITELMRSDDSDLSCAVMRFRGWINEPELTPPVARILVKEPAFNESHRLPRAMIYGFLSLRRESEDKGCEQMLELLDGLPQELLASIPTHVSESFVEALKEDLQTKPHLESRINSLLRKLHAESVSGLPPASGGHGVTPNSGATGFVSRPLVDVLDSQERVALVGGAQFLMRVALPVTSCLKRGAALMRRSLLVSPMRGVQWHAGSIFAPRLFARP